jgi:hypothetical protein
MYFSHRLQSKITFGKYKEENLEETKKTTVSIRWEKPPAFTKNAKFIAEVKEKGIVLFDSAKALVLKTDDDRIRMADIREQARQLSKSVDQKFSDSLSTAKMIYEFVRDGISSMKTDPKSTVEIANEKMSDYDLEKKRKADEEARKAAVEKARLDKIEADKLLARAAKAEEKGNEEKAEILREQATQVNNFVPTAETGPEKQTRTESGLTSGRLDFTIEVVNPAVFIQQVVLNGGNFGFVEFKNYPIKRYAENKRIGDTLPAIPGCRLTPKVSYSGRASK